MNIKVCCVIILINTGFAGMLFFEMFVFNIVVKDVFKHN